MSLNTDRQVAVANELSTKHGLRSEAVAGILGNIDVETGGTFDFTQKQVGGGPGRGLFQFEGGHLSAYRNFLTRNSLRDSASHQIDYVMNNIFDGEGFDIGAGNREILRDAFANGDAAQVATLFSNLFERPGIPQIERRVASAERYFDALDPDNTSVNLEDIDATELPKTYEETAARYPVGGLPGTFDQPHPKGIPAPKQGEKYTSSQYPFNHVFETESGHITEYDDSPFGKRILVEHADGSFEEIVTTKGGHEKVVRVEGDSYEIVAGSKFISIGSSGARKDGKTQAEDALVLTVHGTMRQLIQGNYILEVEGDYTQKIHGSMHTKVGAGGSGNMLEEIKGDFASRVEGKSGTTINKTYNLTVGQDSIHTVKGSAAYTAQGDTKIHSVGTSSVEGIAAANLHGVIGTSVKGGITTIGAATAIGMNAPLIGIGTFPTSVSVNVGNIASATSISGAVTNISGIASVFIDGAFIHMNLFVPGSAEASRAGIP